MQADPVRSARRATWVWAATSSWSTRDQAEVAAALEEPVEGGASDAAKSMMTFFITSTGSGAMGGNLGGLRRCRQEVPGSGSGRRWRRPHLARLPERQRRSSGGAANAKDRIGSGPWVNQKGTVIAKNLTELHTPGTSETMLGPNLINATNGLNEKGGTVLGRVGASAAMPNEHDILTGSNPDGTLFPGDTCSDWTSTTGTAYVGHFDRAGTQPASGLDIVQLGTRGEWLHRSGSEGHRRRRPDLLLRDRLKSRGLANLAGG